MASSAAPGSGSKSGRPRKSSGERRRLKPEIRRLEILEAAARVMRRSGAAAGVEDVVREAGAARGTFYLYFPSWEILVQELRRLVFAEFARRSAALVAPPADGDWPGQVSRFAVAFVDFTTGLGGMHEALFHGPGADLAPGAYQSTAARPIAELLQAGCAAGELAVSDPEATARLLYVAMHETADAICGGQARVRSLLALDTLIRRATAAT